MILMSKQVIVDQSFWELFPEGAIYVMELTGIDNHKTEGDLERFEQLLNQAVEKAERFFTEETFSHNEVIAVWREAFKQFKTKKGARSSIEALLKRASKGHSFRSINPLVDIYNSVSIEYGIPCGGETVDAIDGDMHLGTAQGGEAFRPLGEDEDSPALEGEMIYYDESGAICRCLNWREAERTMLTPETTHAILVIETVQHDQRERAEEAMQTLRERCEDYFGVSAQTYQLTKDQPSAQLDT